MPSALPTLGFLLHPGTGEGKARPLPLLLTHRSPSLLQQNSRDLWSPPPPHGPALPGSLPPPPPSPPAGLQSPCLLGWRFPRPNWSLDCALARKARPCAPTGNASAGTTYAMASGTARMAATNRTAVSPGGCRCAVRLQLRERERERENRNGNSPFVPPSKAPPRPANPMSSDAGTGTAPSRSGAATGTMTAPTALTSWTAVRIESSAGGLWWW